MSEDNKHWDNCLVQKYDPSTGFHTVKMNNSRVVFEVAANGLLRDGKLRIILKQNMYQLKT